MLKRLFGIRGYNTEHLREVEVQADAIAKERQQLNETLTKYIQHPDPFMAMVSDLHNKREMAERR